MEGQDVARLATAGDITDSYVEQGLEAELSVDLERNGGAGNSDDGPQRNRRFPTRRSGEPDSPRCSQERRIGKVRASHPRMRSWFHPPYLNYGGFRRLRGQLWLALQFQVECGRSGGSPLCTDVISARESPRRSSVSADATAVPDFGFGWKQRVFG